MKIAVYGSRRQAPFREILLSFFRRLKFVGAELYAHDKLYDHLTGELDFPDGLLERVTRCPDDIELVLSIGGDGTFLRTAAWIRTLDIPILGINTGNLGYLSGLPVDLAAEHIDDIISMKFAVEKRSLLQVDAPAIQGVWPMALNEVVVAKDDNASMITASITLNDCFLADYKADGVIVSTPTGSTAYNLSVGGPIVQPIAPVWIISPIAAHSLSLRPLVVEDNTVIELRVEGRGRTFRLTVDGRAHSLPLGTTVRLSKAAHQVAIVQTDESCFPHILTSKLLFN
ncbi:MAG: NAD(+)/NADH kinase [Muribaculaceae bacterium]|nr:NAD(+)/NADH kinase [Muribaculaceae bacterium]